MCPGRVHFTVTVGLGTDRAVRAAAAAGLLCRPGLTTQGHGASEGTAMIFKGVRDGRPYPDHGLTHRQWAQIPPRQIRLDELVMTTTVLALDRLLSEDSTFYGDLFPHASRTACTAPCARRCATAPCCTPGCSTWTPADIVGRIPRARARTMMVVTGLSRERAI